MTGLFITFEGGDGSGKSTQSRLLADWLAADREVVFTREPGGTEVGLEIRQILLHTDAHIAERAEALLYAADRAHHIATVVRPALERGAVVLQDRYLDSSIAYQGEGRALEPDDIRDLSLWAAEGLMPHLTVLIDLPSEVGRQRLAARDARPDRLESAGDDFHERVRRAYLKLADADPGRFLVVDGTASVEEIQGLVRERVTTLVGRS